MFSRRKLMLSIASLLSAGTYTVTVTATNSTGTSPGVTQTITVLPPNGFTTFVPASPFGEGSTFNGAGTRIIYVSSSTGNDSHPGTAASPVASLQKAGTLLRSGFQDWILLKRGDSWTAQGFWDSNGNSIWRHTTPVAFTPPSAEPPFTPVTCALLGSYGTIGARPLIRSNYASAAAVQAGAVLYSYTGVPYDYIAVVGIEFYSYQRDPSVPANLSVNDFWNTISAVFLDYGANWVHFEDCKFDFTPGQVGSPGDANTTGNYFGIYRCVVNNNFRPSGHGGQGYFGGGFQNLTIIESYFDSNGWSPVWLQPASVTISSVGGPGTPLVVTWPNSSNFLENNATVYFTATGGGVTAGWRTGSGTPYFVVNQSGDTFQVSASSGGAAVNYSGSGLVSPQNMVFADASASIFARNFYIHDVGDLVSPFYAYYPSTLKRTLSSRSSSEASQQRGGGTCWDNHAFMCPIGFTLVASGAGSGGPPTAGIFANSVCKYNIIQGATDIQDGGVVGTQNGLTDPRGLGFYFDWILNPGTGPSTLDAEFNIISCAIGPTTVNQQAATLDTNTNACTFSNNIIYQWNQGIIDNGTNNVKNNNAIDLTGLNTAGYPDPGRNIATYMVHIGQGYTTSSTSLTIALGTQTLTAATGLSFETGVAPSVVGLVSNANSANNMSGTVTSYNSATGVLVINVFAKSGSGANADWTIGRSDDFFAACYAQRSGGGWNPLTETWVPTDGVSWVAAYQINTVNNWIRAGFNMSPVPALP